MLKVFTHYLKTTAHFKALFILLITASLITLTACSPHPGTGKWKTDASNSYHIDIINISFEGNADFYTDGKEESIHRCFWSATGKQTMTLQCVYSEDSEKKIIYQFEITENNHAKLTHNEQTIALFTLQKPEKEASFW